MLEIQIGPARESVTIPEPPQGLLTIEPAGQQRRGACVVLLALRDTVPEQITELEEARMLLMAAAAVPDDLPLTLAFAGEGHALLRHGPHLSGAISAIIGNTLTRRLSRASIIIVPRSAIASSSAGYARAAHDFDLWARANDFSTIIAGACGGVLAYLANAKAQGLAASETKLTILLGMLTVETRLSNGLLLDHPVYLSAETLERTALARVDQVVVRSEQALVAAQRTGFKFPSATSVIPFRLPSEISARAQCPPGRALVFLGPLDARSGLVTFCDAVDRLAGFKDVCDGLRVVAIGPSSDVYGVDSCSYLRKRVASWPFPLEIAADLTWDAMQLSVGRLPREALTVEFPELRGTPFAALAENAGFAFVAPDPNRPDNPSALCELVLQSFTEPGRSTAAELPSAQALSNALAAPLVRKFTEVKQTAAVPPVTVCVSYFNRPALLRQTLEAIAASDYPDLEIVVVDDGSEDPGIAEEQNWIEPWLAAHEGQLVRQPNRHLGAVRNAAFRNSSGAFVVFLDDDNLPCRDMISRFVQVQQATDAAIVTSRFAVFEGTALIRPERDIPRLIAAPLGPSLSAAAIWNCFGDATMLISREAFERIGGFAEDYGYAHGDWELYTRAAVLGLRIEQIPLPLFWYRVASDSMMRQRECETADLLRNLRAYAVELAPEIYRIVQLAQGLEHRLWTPSEQSKERARIGLDATRQFRWDRADHPSYQ